MDGEDESFDVGTRVQITNTANVQQRAAEYVSDYGVITEVPQHPNTWFKVRARAAVRRYLFVGGVCQCRPAR